MVFVRFNLKDEQVTESDFNTIVGYLNGEEVHVVVVNRLASSNEIIERRINVYPNPANEVLNVVVSENANIRLLDMNGRQVYVHENASANTKLEVHVGDISNGVYTMEIYNDNFYTVKKVVIKK